MRGRPGAGSEPDWVDEPEIRLVGNEQDELGWHLSTSPSRSGGPPRRPRRSLAAVIAVLLLALGAVSAVSRRGPSKATPAVVPVVIATPSPRPPRGRADPIPLPVVVLPAGSSAPILAPTRPVDVALSAGSIFILLAGPPSELVRTSADGARQQRRTLDAGATRLAVDGSTVWVVTAPDSPNPASSRVTGYDAGTLSQLGPSVTVPGLVGDVAAGAGTLWVASTAGLYYLRSRRPLAPVGGVLQSVQALSLDPSRHRLIVALPGLAGGTALISVDPATAVVTGTGHLPLVDVSLAAAAHSVWYAGYGDPGGYGGIGEFQPNSLTPGPDRSDQLSIGPGARIWPGQEVIWVNSSGNGLTSCVSDTSGAVLATWADLTGPFASVKGLRTSIGGGSARVLTSTGGCLG